MNDTKISVIVPVYKVEPYLRKCLDSIVNQTHRDLEIILVDDGSPDNCGAICDEYAARDPRVRVLHTENRGAFAARNTALDMADGDYIGFVDADDWLKPEMYATLLELAEAHCADIAQCEMCNAGEYAQIRNQVLGGVAVFHREELPRELFRETVTHGLQNKLFRQKLFRQRRFQEKYYHMDATFIAGIIRTCGTFVRTDAALYYYNTTNPSITRGRKNSLHITSAEALFEAYSRAAEGVPGGSFFICREIPSFGRLIPPGEMVPVGVAVGHIRYMHEIFLRHWATARRTAEYRASPLAKRVLWQSDARCPLAASVRVFVRGWIKR